MSKGDEDHDTEIHKLSEPELVGTQGHQTERCGDCFGVNQVLCMWATVVKFRLFEKPLAMGQGSIPGP